MCGQGNSFLFTEVGEEAFPSNLVMAFPSNLVKNNFLKICKRGKKDLI
jgi:hypothetical protein